MTTMDIGRLSRALRCVVVMLLLLEGARVAHAQERQILYTRDASAGLQQLAAAVCSTATPRAPCNDGTLRSGYFARLAPRRFILDDAGKLLPGAQLGTRPHVFLTAAEKIPGLSLVDLYLAIGYEAEDILRWQRDEAMVLVLFRYADDVRPSPVTNGLLPDDWRTRIYVPTWQNVIALLDAYARTTPLDASFSRSERDFLLSVDDAARRTIAMTPYGELRARGGLAWTYRSLLEQKLSVFEHFRGTGRTQNEVRDPEGVEEGLPEFIAPNRKLSEFAEIVIVDAGSLSIRDSYGQGCHLCSPHP